MAFILCPLEHNREKTMIMHHLLMDSLGRVVPYYCSGRLQEVKRTDFKN